MFHPIKIFLSRTDGAVTVDWVVLTALIIGLCVLVTIPFYTGSSGAASQMVTMLLDAVNTVKPN